ESTALAAFSALDYLAILVAVACLYRVIVLTLRGPSCSSPTFGRAPPLVRRHLCCREGPGFAPCAPDRRRSLGAWVLPPHIPLPPLSMVPRRAALLSIRMRRR
ncbi:hypothetical protein C8R45DRAFT_1045446, partial [Mycena sanguinolenta]